MRLHARRPVRSKQLRPLKERLFSARWPKELRAALEGGAEYPLKIYGGIRRPKRLWFFTKDFLCKLWIQRDELREDWMALVRYGVPTQQQLSVIEQLRAGPALPIAFIGGLDPLDLCVFVLLRLALPSARIRYRGVDDEWLELCREYCLPEQDFSLLSVPMKPFERRAFEILRSQIDLNQFIGPRSVDLLSRGKRFPLEPASNLTWYRPGFLRALNAHLCES